MPFRGTRAGYAGATETGAGRFSDIIGIVLIIKRPIYRRQPAPATEIQPKNRHEALCFCCARQKPIRLGKTKKDLTIEKNRFTY